MIEKTHPKFIRLLLEYLGSRSYLELGLFAGETFNLACQIIPRCVGVDVNPIGLLGQFIHSQSCGEPKREIVAPQVQTQPRCHKVKMERSVAQFTQDFIKFLECVSLNAERE